ncbi:MAG TPA: orotidine-5'-phosphate decarboxylase [Arenicellales bacterium]|jgi:orotidine-5'-phosphate decarboxylase|nr:orotidine-5'-phosphate decarboxylase [Arenicellales bacterium]HJP06354.1 orotidine-5'-phosphate decarboxylase [Arenicellales bacterium]
MSRAPVDARDRLIVALDVPSGAEARALVKELGDTVSFYKVGLELFTGTDGFRMVDWLAGQDKQIFVDLKFFDVPATVARAVRQLRGRQITFATVHGNDAMMRAAAEASGEVGILAVTVLTSLDAADMQDLGFDCDIPDLVRSRAKRAVALGCAGVVASGQEAAVLRQSLGDEGLIVTPGIRPGDHDDDQKRAVTPAQALHDGADYLVVGRPIRDAASPRDAARSIQAEIASALAEARP